MASAYASKAEFVLLYLCGFALAVHLLYTVHATPLMKATDPAIPEKWAKAYNVTTTVGTISASVFNGAAFWYLFLFATTSRKAYAQRAFELVELAHVLFGWQWPFVEGGFPFQRVFTAVALAGSIILVLILTTEAPTCSCKNVLKKTQ